MVDQVEKCRSLFAIAAMKIERDVRLHELTDDEERSLVAAILSAYNPNERLREALERVAELETALRPFAAEAEQYTFAADCNGVDVCPDAWSDDDWLADTPTEFKVGDLRKAREALARTSPSGLRE